MLSDGSIERSYVQHGMYTYKHAVVIDIEF